MDLTEALAAIKAGTLDAQENPFSNTVTYGVPPVSIASTPRPITSTSRVRSSCTGRHSTHGRRRCRTNCATRSASAVAFQRDLHVKEEDDAVVAIRKAGGEIVELTTDEHEAFVVGRQPDLRRGSRTIQPRPAGAGQPLIVTVRLKPDNTSRYAGNDFPRVSSPAAAGSTRRRTPGR